MKKILKIELGRALNGIGMILGTIIGVASIIYQLMPIIERELNMEYIYEINGGFYSYWLPRYLDGSTIYYFYFIGIIAALPYGISYYKDKKSGIIKNICNRVDRHKYIMAKYIATFVSGGLAVTIPIVVDFFAIKLICPVDSFVACGEMLRATSEGMVFIVDHPYIAAIILTFAWFIFGGALATVSLVVSTITNNFFTIQLSPFFIMLILFYLPTLLPTEYNCFFPFYFLTLFGQVNFKISFGISILFAIVTFAIYTKMEINKDII